MRSALVLSALAALAAVPISAQLTVTQPSNDVWWVDNSLNTLAWTGTTPTQFTVFLSNPDVNLLTSDLALASIVQTYIYSLTIVPAQWNAGTNYTIKLANPINGTDVYATSEPFEIKPMGSIYPVQSTTAASTATVGSATGSSTGSASSSASAASASASKSTSDALLKVNANVLGAVKVATSISLVVGAVALYVGM